MFELIVDKKIAFIIQALSWSLFLIFFHINSSFKYKSKNKVILAFICLFLYFISIAISSIITYYLKSFDYIWIYMLVSIYFGLLLISPYTLNYDRMKNINFQTPIFILTIYIVTIAIFEQLEFIPIMPGSWYVFDIVRPSSTFGSMQHYAITLSILFFINLEIYLNNLKLRYLLASSIALIGTIISFTRSGAMILAFGATLYFIILIYNISIKHKVSKTNLFFLLTFIIISFTSLFFLNETVFIDRILSSLDVNEAGNNTRIGWWEKGVYLWRETNIFFGSYSGYITNATNRLSSGKSFVVESSVIQQLLNFGLIGCLSFYMLLFIQFFKINKEHLLLKCCMASSILQTFVFQSIESIPFMVTLTLIPILSNNLCKDNAYSN